MSGKPVIPRQRAVRDVEEAVDYYATEAGVELALRFVDAVQRAYAHIGRHPTTGSTRHAHELGLPGLRSWPVERFPHVVFYFERADYLDVWRVLHGEADIPEWMREP